MISEIANYPGSKTVSGIIPFLINNIPYHTHYYELCAGSAALARSIKPCRNWPVINDIDKAVFDALNSDKTLNSHRHLKCRDAVEILLKGINTNPIPATAFVYLDPPYPFSCRKSHRPIYNHEMTDDDHIKLLQAARKVKASVMISTRENPIYTKMLKDWRVKEFKTVDRGGAATELIYMNYPEPEILHQYDYLGDQRTRRQTIRRNLQSFANKIDRLPKYEKHALILKLLEKETDLAKHFIATLQIK